MAADDVFGDSSLFEEFEKEREASSSFIFYEKDDQGSEDRSRIVFQFSESSSSESDSEDELKPKVQEQSVALALQRLNKHNGKSEQNGRLQSDGSSGSDDNDDVEPFIGQDRQEKSTIFKLTHERNKYKRFCNIIDSTRFIHDEESSAVQVLFQNNPFSRKYRVEIEDFVKHLLEKERHSRRETLQKLDLKASIPSCTDLNDKIPGERRTEHLRQTHVILGCSQFYQDYMLDTLGWPMVEYNPSLTDSWEIPVYEVIFTDPLPIDEEMVKANAKKMEKERSKPKCWNCGGDHMLGDCKEPRNQQRINDSRQEMMAQQKQQQQSGPPKSGRYHKEKSVDPKYDKYKPGHLSDELREALGLADSQVPIYIYKMRALGYPPGWMEEAKSAPVLSMFDENGEDVDESEGAEEGIDPEKIIEYPGFTVELPSNVVDEAELYSLPPIQPHQLKKTLMASLQDQQQIEKRGQKECEEQERKRLKLDTVDMDVDDDQSNESVQPPLPMETPPSKPPPPDNTPPSTPKGALQSRLSLSREASQGRSDSPTLAELESQYQLIQKTLQTEDGEVEDGELIVLDSADDDSQESVQSVDQSVIEIEDSVDEGKASIILTDDSIDEVDITDETKSKLVRNMSTTSIQTFGELGIGSPGSSVPGTPSHNPFTDMKPSFKGTMSVSKDYGTPVLNRSGSYTALPQDNKFSQGIEEHIPFENLPETTGTFDKMRKLISKIRDVVPSRKKKS